MTAAAVRRALRRHARPAKAKVMQGFFKTGPGQYGEGDVFLGVTVPNQRVIARQFRDLPLAEVKKLLTSRVHEERLTALIILVGQFKRGDEATRRRLYDFYLKHTRWINNWDLVDTSAEYIVGAWLDKDRGLKSSFPILNKLARSKNLWERRIAMLSTFHFIKRGNPKPALAIATILLNDKHDLIHKAVGWMLRELGEKCSLATEGAFLKKHAAHMPRTMLRYAIEKFPRAKQKRYLLMKVG